MKKLMLALAIASMSTAAIAQETVTVTDVPVKENSVETLPTMKISATGICMAMYCST